MEIRSRSRAACRTRSSADQLGSSAEEVRWRRSPREDRPEARPSSRAEPSPRQRSGRRSRDRDDLLGGLRERQHQQSIATLLPALSTSPPPRRRSRLVRNGLRGREYPASGVECPVHAARAPRKKPAADRSAAPDRRYPPLPEGHADRARSTRWRTCAGAEACCTNAPATSLNRLGRSTSC